MLCRHKPLLLSMWPGVLFLVWFNSFDRTKGFYWSYTLLLSRPFLCAWTGYPNLYQSNTHHDVIFFVTLDGLRRHFLDWSKRDLICSLWSKRGHADDLLPSFLARPWLTGLEAMCTLRHFRLNTLQLTSLKSVALPKFSSRPSLSASSFPGLQSQIMQLTLAVIEGLRTQLGFKYCRPSFFCSRPSHHPVFHCKRSKLEVGRQWKWD